MREVGEYLLSRRVSAKVYLVYSWLRRKLSSLTPSSMEILNNNSWSDSFKFPIPQSQLFYPKYKSISQYHAQNTFPKPSRPCIENRKNSKFLLRELPRVPRNTGPKAHARHVYRYRQQRWAHPHPPSGFSRGAAHRRDVHHPRARRRSLARSGEEGGRLERV